MYVLLKKRKTKFGQRVAFNALSRRICDVRVAGEVCFHDFRQLFDSPDLIVVISASAKTRLTRSYDASRRSPRLTVIRPYIFSP